MASPIRNLIHGNILQVDIIEDDNSVIGVVRSELNDGCLVVHPLLYSPTKTKVKRFVEECVKALRRISDEFGYPCFNLCTHNAKFIKMLFGEKAYVIGNHPEGVLYEYDMRT